MQVLENVISLIYVTIIPHYVGYKFSLSILRHIN